MNAVASLKFAAFLADCLSFIEFSSPKILPNNDSRFLIIAIATREGI
jgi:hypothetical protein